jgi:hypothetical protein
MLGAGRRVQGARDEVAHGLEFRNCLHRLPTVGIWNLEFFSKSQKAIKQFADKSQNTMKQVSNKSQKTIIQVPNKSQKTIIQVPNKSQ